MNLDQIVHNRVALLIGDALIRKTTFEAEAEILRQQVAALQKKIEEAKPAKPSSRDAS